MYTAAQQAKMPGEAGKVNVAEAAPAAPRQPAGQKPAAAPAATAQNKPQGAPAAASATPPAANKKLAATGSIDTAPHVGAAPTMLSSSSGEQAIAGNTSN